MSNSLNLSQELKLSQRLSPMQIRYVKLLEMNSPEADEMVRREIDDNPALEANVEADIQPTTDDGSAFNETAEDIQRADYKDDDIPYYRLEVNNRSADDDRYEFIPQDDNETLYDHLTRQLEERELDDNVVVAAKYIIGNLDSNGYLLRKVADIIDDLEFNQGITISETDASEGLEIVRSLEPHGVGASNLQDCLLLQLTALKKNEITDTATAIIRDFFDVFSLKHYRKIISGMKISDDEFKQALDLILSLNPKPGAAIGGSYSDGSAQQIVPDFIVDIDDDNEITISLNNKIPELRIDESFSNAVAMMENNAKRRDAKGNAFIVSRYNDARDFIEAIKMRQQTLFSVMSAIVKLQKEYFLTEDEHMLRPMGLKDVAQLTGYDISVVSRSTNNKYVATSWGILPLRFFFSEGVGEGDDEASAREIQAAIRTIIEGEDKHNPLSDDLICKTLKEKGYNVSRRTVAKYRDRLGISVARLRKVL